MGLLALVALQEKILRVYPFHFFHQKQTLRWNVSIRLGDRVFCLLVEARSADGRHNLKNVRAVFRIDFPDRFPSHVNTKSDLECTALALVPL